MPSCMGIALDGINYLSEKRDATTMTFEHGVVLTLQSEAFGLHGEHHQVLTASL
jgi:hypothetical protein